MLLEDIVESWKEDSKIDSSNLSDESEKTYALHAKYMDIYSLERLTLKTLQLDMKRLELAKHEFLLQGPSKETQSKGWVYPVSGKVLVSDEKLYREADKQIQDLSFRIEQSQVKVDVLYSIINAINQRVYTVNSMIKREIWAKQKPGNLTRN